MPMTPEVARALAPFRRRRRLTSRALVDAMTFLRYAFCGLRPIEASVGTIMLAQQGPSTHVVDIVAQLPAAAPAREIVEEDAEHILVQALRMAGGVRRYDDVGHVPQGRRGIERLALEDVEIGAGQPSAN